MWLWDAAYSALPLRLRACRLPTADCRLRCCTIIAAVPAAPTSMQAASHRHAAALLGCVWCDALNLGRHGAEARCWRCLLPLDEAPQWHSREARARLSAAAALLTAALVCMLVALTLPMVSLDLRGNRSSVSLGSAVHVLWQQGRLAIAAALFVTTVAAPLLELLAMFAVVLSLDARARRPRMRRAPAPRWLLALLHTWQTMREWNMTEVLVLGTAVSLVKLGQLATLIVGPGLISLMAFMALRLAALRWLTPLQAWAMLPEDAAARARRDGA